MSRRLRLLVTGLVIVVVAAVAALVVTDPFSSSPAPTSAGLSAGPPSSSSSSSSPAQGPQVSSTVDPALAPTPPAQGAYLGAWVGPDVFTQANEISAVDALQQQIGRKLSIVHTYVQWQARFPTRSDMTFLNQGNTLLISWAGAPITGITSGADDAWIRTRASQIKALGKPVFLEWRWEMDRPNLRSQVLSGPDYVAAWDHIRAIFAAVGVHNAAWVWCPTAAGFGDGRAAAYYPGDAEVDWVCADAYPPYGTKVSFAATVDPFLSWAAHHDKPVMIGEFGVPESYGAQQRAQWLRAAQQVVLADHQIKALVYFDANPAGQGPEGSYSLGGAGGAGGSDGSGAALAAFGMIARQPYFNPAG